jgi:ribose 1,5-bisphosphokinase PhnN
MIEKKLHHLVALVGPSGSGKTTVMQELVAKVPEIKIMKSITSRPKREGDPTEDEFYEFVNLSVFCFLENQSEIAYSVRYDGNSYGLRTGAMHKTLAKNVGVGAFTEDGVIKLKALGIPLSLIKIVPMNPVLGRKGVAIARTKEDAKREKLIRDHEYDLIAYNDLTPVSLVSIVEHIKLELTMRKVI